MKISHIHAREILDSRGYPTVETLIKTEDGFYAISSVPSGSSTGSHEACELRDNDPERFDGKGVLKACHNVNAKIAPHIMGMDVEDQELIDNRMIELDGSENKANYGANAMLSVSEACLKLAANCAQVPLYRYVLEYYKLTKNLKIPQPTLNVINGGKHGNGRLDFQEFHILPRINQSFTEMMRMASEIYMALKDLMSDKKIYQGLGDEGGFTGDFRRNYEALEYLESAIGRAGYIINKDVKLGLDFAATEFYGADGKYHISDMSFPLTFKSLVDYYEELSFKYDWGYLEDPLAEDDWTGWKYLYKNLGKYILIGDDLITTNPIRLSKAIKEKVCNAVLVKPNQIGTVTEFMRVIDMAKKANWKVIMSHRSGETNDTFIADIAVGVGADMVKFGAPARGERISKYNRLMEIEEELKKK